MDCTISVYREAGDYGRTGRVGGDDVIRVDRSER